MRLDWREVLQRGETRQIGVIVTAIKGSAVPVFSDPVYRVLDQDGNEVQPQTPAVVDGNQLFGMLTETENKGRYVVRFEYVIGDEKFIDDVIVRVEC